MKLSIRELTLGAALTLASALAACGGGGSGTSAGSGAIPTLAPTIGPSSGPTATATPSLPPPSTPGPSSAPTGQPTVAANATVSGTIVDYTSGAGISGATVGLSPQNAAINPTTVATTAADGTFSAPVTSSGSFVLVVAATGRPTLHANVTISAGANALGTYKLVSLTSEDTSEIALINSDRAAHGGAPAVIPDEYAMEVARYHASDMAGNTGLGAPYFSHTDRNGASPQARYAAANGIGGDSETICGGVNATFATCEATYIAEGPPPAGQVNHYSIIVNPAQVWVGVGSSTAAPVNGITNSTVYDEEYIQYPF